MVDGAYDTRHGISEISEKGAFTSCVIPPKIWDSQGKVNLLMSFCKNGNLKIEASKNVSLLSIT